MRSVIRGSAAITVDNLVADGLLAKGGYGAVDPISGCTIYMAGDTWRIATGFDITKLPGLKTMSDARKLLKLLNGDKK